MSAVAPELGPRTRPVGVRLVAAVEVPAGDVWLGPREREVLGALRFPKRRADWRLGRYTAKCAAAAWLGRPSDPLALAELEVLADDSGAPQLHSGSATPIALSLSHRAGWALAAVAPRDVALGCDLELVEPRSEAFLADYFTTSERAFVAADGPGDVAHRTTLVWCAKECALKALHEGLRLDTWSVELAVRDGGQERGWWRVAARAAPVGPTFEGWWRGAWPLLACVLGAPALEAPFSLA
jgi:4'-phosphopantetheinyl transferase